MIRISVYIDTGVVYEYDVDGHASAREHLHAIVTAGYQHTANNKLTWWPPHRIVKVTATGKDISTSYPDEIRGT